MSSDPTPPSGPAPAIHGHGETDFFSLDVVAELAGINTRTVLHYQALGLIQPLPRGRAVSSGDNGGTDDGSVDSGLPATVFDTECLRQLRRIEHLRETCGVNDAGLRLILSLLQQVEQLRQERRQARA